MKRSELKQLIREVIQEVYDKNTIATITTSKGDYKLWSDDVKEDDVIKTEYYVEGPDGKEHYVTLSSISPYQPLSKQNIEDIKKWIEGGMQSQKL